MTTYGASNVRLGDVATIVAGQSPPGSTYRTKPEGLPFFQGKADFGSLHPIARIWCTDPVCIAQPGDILISVRAPVGPTNVADTESAIGRGLAAIRCGPSLDQRYALWVLRSREKDIAARGSGSTFSAIGRSDLESLEFVLPSLPEQRRIVRKLEQQLGLLDNARAASQARLEAAKQLPAGYLRAVFEEGEAARWPRHRLGDFAETKSGSTPSRVHPEYFVGDVPWLTTTELRDADVWQTSQHISETAVVDHNLRLFPPGTLFVAMVGQGQTRGRTGILRIPSTCSQNAFGILPEPARFDSYFLQAWFRYRYLALRQESAARGGGQPIVSGAVLREERVPLPSISDQIRLTDRFRLVEAGMGRIRDAAIGVDRAAGELASVLAETAIGARA
ncbi:MAG: restriction endonuclease subunit S [Dehalococcoidia bacterium]